MDEKQKYQVDGLKWLHELEVLNHPQVINNIKLNIFITSKHIKEVELLIYREKKSMLVLVELGWFGRKFFKKRIFEDVHNTLQQLLPSFRFRVTDDPAIMNLAVERVKQALSGGTHEKASNPALSPNNELLTNEPAPRQDTQIENIEGRTEDLPTNQEEQPKTDEQVFSNIGLKDLLDE